jgi:hypothetical protein
MKPCAHTATFTVLVILVVYLEQNPGGEEGDASVGDYPTSRWSNQWPKVRLDLNVTGS